MRTGQHVDRGPHHRGHPWTSTLAGLLALVMIVGAGACSGSGAPAPTASGSATTASGATSPAGTSPSPGVSSADGAAGIAALPVSTEQVGDARLAWRTVGSGPPVVLVMGLAGTLEVWSPPFLQALARHYVLVVFDNRGMGRSGDGDRPVTIETMADDTAGLMRKLGYREYAVLGFSMGSLVAQEVALRQPSHVRALVLYATTPGGREAVLDAGAMTGSGDAEAGHGSGGASVSPGPDSTAGPGAATLLDLARRLFPEKYRRAHPDYMSLVPKPRSLYDLRGFGRQIGALAAWRGSWTRLPRLNLPVLLLTGAEDELTPPVNAQRMAARIPGSWLVRIPGGGHGVMYQYPEQVAQVVTTFLGVNGYGD